MKKILTLGLAFTSIVLFSACGNPTTPTPTPSNNQDSRKTQIDASCQSFFDGCNTCQRVQSGEAACTMMYCETYEAPKCLDEESKLASEESGNTVSRPAPTPSYNQDSWKTQIDANCQSFFDGCNTCKRMNNGEAACTRMYCETYQVPRCLDSEVSKEPDRVANPASEYCLTQGGESKINKNADGSEYGVCVIDGEEIDEWEYFKQSTSQFVGRPFAEVQKEFEESGANIRIAVEDGKPRALTADYRPDRLNVEVEKGIIINAYFG